MDAEYLKKNVGVVLSDGLASVLLNNPEDPVDYLSQYLLKYVDNQKRSEGQIQNRSKIAARELVVKCEQAQRNEKIEATAITRANILIADQRFADSADSCSTILQLLSLFANHFCQRLEATGVGPFVYNALEFTMTEEAIRFISGWSKTLTTGSAFAISVPAMGTNSWSVSCYRHRPLHSTCLKT
uniref:RIIa domain-containing protein n=1 Tax=Spongospora subterranea TaxID=70186 RepID=A0A0H5QFV1_9EUKA